MNDLLVQEQAKSNEPTEFPSLTSLKSCLNVPQRQRRKSNRNQSDANSTELELLEEESGETVSIDPITKKPIEHPVRNKKCKHIYDKSSFLTFIRSGNNPRCPTMGCANRVILTAQSIEEVPSDEYWRWKQNFIFTLHFHPHSNDFFSFFLTFALQFSTFSHIFSN